MENAFILTLQKNVNLPYMLQTSRLCLLQVPQVLSLSGKEGQEVAPQTPTLSMSTWT